MCGKEWQYSCKREVSTLPGPGYTKFIIKATLQRPRNSKLTLKDVVCLLEWQEYDKAKISTIILRRGD